MKCSKCGADINNNDVYCPNCGQSINNNLEVKTNNKKVIYIIILIIISIIFFAVGFIIGNSFNKNKCICDKSTLDDNTTTTEKNNNDNNETYTYKKFDVSNIDKVLSKEDDLSKNVEIDSIFFNTLKNNYSKYEESYIYGKNNNNVPVEVKIYLDYYDSEGYRIYRDIRSSVVKSNSEFVLLSTVKDDSLDYETIKLSYEASNFKSYYTDINLKETDIVSNMLTDKTIDITINNSSNNEIKNGNSACLYYKNKELVFATNAYFSDIESGTSGKATCFKNKISNGELGNDEKLIDFDDYKVVVFSSYDYDNENY